MAARDLPEGQGSSQEEMSDILRYLGHSSEVVTNFSQEKVHPAVVPLLTDAQLKSLGVTAMGDIASLRSACRASRHGMEHLISEAEALVGTISLDFHQLPGNQNLLEFYHMRLESAMLVFEDVVDDVEPWLQQHFHGAYQRIRSCYNSLQVLVSGSPSTVPAGITGNIIVATSTGRPGRPRLSINIDLVLLMLDAGYPLTDISQSLSVSRSTLWRRLKEANVTVGRYTDISDADLDGLLRTIQTEHPHSGLTIIQGHLLSMGIRVQRSKIRESIQRIDPMRRERWGSVITRRVYSVPGPNSLWHIDGNHKLIRWRFVIHGGIDGYSRLITYLHCSTNNSSETVYRLFEEAVKVFNVPSRVRSDRGGENTFVCQFMIAYRGVGRGSHLAGASVHNQRIERLWRDVFRCVSSTYHALFNSMETADILDPTSETDLFILHYVFLPRINKSLHEFASAWNHHPLRTERNWTPLRIWLNGVLNPDKASLTAIRDIVEGIPPEGLGDFGLDFSAPIPADEDSIVVPETLAPLSEMQLEEFEERLASLVISEEDPVNIYLYAKDVMQELVSA